MRPVRRRIAKTGAAASPPPAPADCEIRFRPHCDPDIPELTRRLRWEAFRSALWLARPCNLADLIVPTPRWGVGYLFRSTPEGDSITNLNRQTSTAAAAWWVLADFCDLDRVGRPVRHCDDFNRSFLGCVVLDARAPVLSVPSFCNGQLHARVCKFWRDHGVWPHYLHLSRCYSELRASGLVGPRR